MNWSILIPSAVIIVGFYILTIRKAWRGPDDLTDDERFLMDQETLGFIDRWNRDAARHANASIDEDGVIYIDDDED